MNALELIQIFVLKYTQQDMNVGKTFCNCQGKLQGQFCTASPTMQSLIGMIVIKVII